MEDSNLASSLSAPTTPKTHRRRPSTFASPVSLPVRTDDSPGTTPKRLTPSPGFKPSPKRSFYLERSLPVSGDEPLPTQSSEGPDQDPILMPIPSYNPDPGLIFDDGDDRLPPPEASPTFRPNSHAADILAMSSPSVSPGTAAQLYENDYEEGPEYSTQLINDRRRSRASVDGRASIDGFEPRSRRSSTPISLSGVSVAESTSTYYPTPIPSQLMRPPRLSKKPVQRKSSLPIEDLPEPPQWGPSPLEESVPYSERLNSLDSVSQLQSMNAFNVGLDDEPHASDVDSDRATIMSDDRDFDNNSEDEQGPEDVPSQAHKRRSWLPKLFRKKSSRLPEIQKDEMGEKYDAKEAETLMAQMAVLDNDVAFSKLDPEAIQRHSQMFDAGGVHSGTIPHSGGPTSLIEELEIRKAGKRIQKQVFSREVREIERQRAEDANSSKNFHPADLVNNTQPTLMQMQYMAEADYDARIKWHTRAINRHYINEHANETLAQRRARLKGEKAKTQHTGTVPETLAQRRQRLRREKEAATMREVEKSLDIDGETLPVDLGEPMGPDEPADALLQDEGRRPTISAI